MRRFLNCCLLLLTFSGIATADDWKLVWQDEFDGKGLNFQQWEIEVNAFGGGNQELQIFTERKENVRVENGHLVLEAHKGRHGVAGTERDFSSGRIRSKHRGDWKYGKMEIRAKLPQGQGIWPAIWMLPTDNKYGVWASSGEIDIMEFKGQEPDTVWGTLHYGGQWPKNAHSGETHKLATGNFCDDFHTFAVEWEEGTIRWYIDGKLWQTQSKWSTPNGKFPAPFDQRFHMVMNVSVGGQFLGNPDDSTVFPAKMLVDYVRVYQK